MVFKWECNTTRRIPEVMTGQDDEFMYYASHIRFQFLLLY
jgi:hypothetical protein